MDGRTVARLAGVVVVMVMLAVVGFVSLVSNLANPSPRDVPGPMPSSSPAHDSALPSPREAGEYVRDAWDAAVYAAQEFWRGFSR